MRNIFFFISLFITTCLFSEKISVQLYDGSRPCSMHDKFQNSFVPNDVEIKENNDMFTCNVLCYGDSNTWGNIPNSFDPQSDLFQRYEREKRWTGVLQTVLGPSFHVIEAAINGRTTDLDEIIPGRPYRNGLSLLLPCLESNYPLDIVIFMLGTNDAQIQYNRSAKDVAEGMRRLIRVVKESNKGRNGNAPVILLVAPQPILRISRLPEEFNENSIRCSETLACYYEKLAEEESCMFLDASQVTTSTNEDGFHLGEKESVLFGHAVARIISMIHSLKITLTQVYRLDEAACALILEKLSSVPVPLIEAFIAQSDLVCLTPTSEQTAMTINPLDALLSAPKTHRLLFENEYVRILESGIAPGESVPLHTHQWDSIYIILQGSRFTGIDHESHTIEEEWGVGIERFDGDKSDSRLYTYTNIGAEPFLSIAFEIKK